MARHLAGYGSNVTVMLLGDSEKIKTDESNWNWSILKKMPSIKLMSGSSLDFNFKPDIIIDGILGTGIMVKLENHTHLQSIISIQLIVTNLP